LEDHPVHCYFCPTVIYAHFLSSSALSEVLGSPLPYDDVLSLRDRMWDISPTLVRYDVVERTSPEVAVAGLQTIAANTASAKVSGKPFLKPISNFYQTDPISRALVSLLLFIFTLRLTHRW
jgi:NADH dehydrogenase (ubiquinone) Fe-S protein 1